MQATGENVKLYIYKEQSRKIPSMFEALNLATVLKVTDRNQPDGQIWRGEQWAQSGAS